MPDNANDIPAAVPRRARLLVSVRSLAEARIAIAGGADLVDVKEPRRGSLGFAGTKTINEISSNMARSSAPPPLSIALGELTDWSREETIPRLPESATYAKLGLANCRRQHDWVRQWRRMRRRFDEAAGRRLGWIAVHYVDSEAMSPSFSQVFLAAQQTGCRGILLDTFNKSNGGLFDHISGEMLAEYRRRTAQAGLLFAVAGGLRMADFPSLVALGPDIIAVRTLACAHGNRQGLLESGAIEAITSALDCATAGQTIRAK